MVAESVTFPIDLTKTRMQLSGSASADAARAHRFGAIGVVSEIAKREGLIVFYKGLSPVIIRHLFYTHIRIIEYENLNGFIRSEANNGESLPLAAKAIVGGTSGVLAQVVASPADLVKVRMQGLKPRYSRPTKAFTKILQSEGIKGLWKGVLPNIADGSFRKVDQKLAGEEEDTMDFILNLNNGPQKLHSIINFLKQLKKH